MDSFDYGKKDIITKLIGVNIRCVNYNNTMNFNTKQKEGEDIILIFIKAVVFQHVGTSWFIHSNRQVKYIFIIIVHIVFDK